MNSSLFDQPHADTMIYNEKYNFISIALACWGETIIILLASGMLRLAACSF